MQCFCFVSQSNSLCSGLPHVCDYKYFASSMVAFTLFVYFNVFFFSAFTLSYTHALTLSVSSRKKECTSKTQQKNPESMCVKVNKIDQAKMNEILSLKFHTRTTIYKFKLYMSNSVRSIKFLSKESERKNTNQVLVRF